MNIFKKIILLGLSTLMIVVFAPNVLAAVANKIPTPIALYEDSLAVAITSSATSFTLVRGTDVVGTSLAASTYGFIIDEGSSTQEFVIADCTATACTNALRGISPITGLNEVSSLKKAHRRGASIKMTDSPILLILKRLINGDDTLPNIISYLSHPSFSSDTQIVDKKYVDDTITSGAPDATTSVKGISKMSVSPVSAASPIAVGDNDPRVPTQDENDALVGTSGTATSSSNKLVDAADVSSSGASGKIVRLNGTTYPAGDGSALTNVAPVIKSYVLGENITAGQAVYVKPSDGKIYKASASANDDLKNRYIGIAAESGSTGDTKNVNIKGKVTISSLGVSDETITETTVYTVTQNTTMVRGGASQSFRNQSFTTLTNQENISSFKVNLKKAGAPNGNLKFDLYAVDINGEATGSSLGGRTFVESNLTTSQVQYELLSSPVTVTPNTKYVMVTTTTSTNLNGTSIEWNLYVNNATSSATSLGGENVYFNNPNTVTDTANYTWDVLIKYTKARYYYIGDSIYLKDTAGTYGITTGTKYKKIGRILSSTEIELDQSTEESLIGSNGRTITTGSSLNNSVLPIPRNTRKILIVGTLSTGTTTPTTGYIIDMTSVYGILTVSTTPSAYLFTIGSIGGYISLSSSALTGITAYYFN